MSALPDVRPAIPLCSHSVPGPLAHLLGPFDPDVVLAAVVALSRFVGERRDRRAGDIYELNRMLLRYGQPSVMAAAGSDPPAPRLRHGATVLRELGLKRSALNFQWRQLVASRGVGAAFEPDMLLALSPAPCVQALCALIADGPGAAVGRIERILHERSLEPAPTRRNRPEGGLIARATLEANVAPVRAMMQLLVDLQRREFPCGALDRWQGVPKIRIPAAEPANTDRSAPPHRLVRRIYADVDRQVKERLGVADDAEELPRIQTMGRTKMKTCGVWRLARTRAMYALTVTLGGRESAICELRRRDVVRDHIGPDGHSAPAIALRPGKTYDEREIHWKAIPVELLRIIDVYLRLTDILITETSWERKSNGRRRAPAPAPHAPLFIGKLKYPDKAFTPGGLYQQLVGHRGYPKHNLKPRSPLLPRGDGNAFSPQALRRAANQATRLAAVQYCREHETLITPEAISEALLDHQMPSDRYGYTDINTLEGREKWSRIAIELNWEMLTGDRGARKTVDRNRINECETLLTVLRAQVAHQQQIIDQALHAAQIGRLTAATGVEIHRATDRKLELRTEIQSLEREVKRLWSDPAARVAVPDDLPDEQLMGVPPSQPSNEDVGLGATPVRDFFTGPELAHVFEISRAQAARWARGEHLPHKPGDPRRPFEPGAIPVDRSLGPRRARFWAGGLKPGSLPTLLARERARDFLAQMPTGWSVQHCEAPLQLPEPFATARGSGTAPVLGFLLDRPIYARPESR